MICNVHLNTYCCSQSTYRLKTNIIKLGKIYKSLNNKETDKKLKRIDLKSLCLLLLCCALFIRQFIKKNTIQLLICSLFLNIIYHNSFV